MYSVGAIMKPIPGKIKKQGRRDAVRILKSCCGTLSYIAECRGTMRTAGSIRWPAQPEGVNKIVRKHPVV